jgi:hypothetical protein
MTRDSENGQRCRPIRIANAKRFRVPRCKESCAGRARTRSAPLRGPARRTSAWVRGAADGTMTLASWSRALGGAFVRTRRPERCEHGGARRRGSRDSALRARRAPAGADRRGAEFEARIDARGQNAVSAGSAPAWASSCATATRAGIGRGSGASRAEELAAASADPRGAATADIDELEGSALAGSVEQRPRGARQRAGKNAVSAARMAGGERAGLSYVHEAQPMGP